MRRKNLMNRVFAGILCATLVFQNVSVTSYATESNVEAETEVITQENVEEASENTDSDLQAAETIVSEAASVGEINTSVVVEETVEATKTTNEQATLVTVLSFELDDLEKTKAYTGSGVFKDLEQLKDNVKVIVDGNEIDAKNDITLTWKAVKADGSLADLPEETKVPVNAGKYKLCVELTGKENAYKSASIENGVEFVITPAKLDINLDLPLIKPGTKAGEINVTADTFAAGQGFYCYTDDATTSDKDESKDSDFTVTVSVRDAITGEILTADTALVKTGDYIMDFTAAFTESGKTKADGNFEIREIDSEDVVFSELIQSYINITFGDTWKESNKITHTYTGSEITAPVNGTDYTAKVQYDSGETDKEGSVIYTDIADVQLTEEWYVLTVAEEYVDTEGNKQKDWEWRKLDTAPVDAGSYSYRLTYAGQEGLYTDAYTDITVVIEPKKVVIRPELMTDATFYDEMSEKDVLAQIDYKVFDTAATPTEVEIDKTTAWGVSYDLLNGQTYTQSYEPIFILQYETKDETGVTVWEDNDGANLDSKKKYRVIFGGDKGIYSGAGVLQTYLPVNQLTNSIELNYIVDTDYDNALSKNFVDIVVSEGTATIVDTTAITEELGGKGDSLDSAYTKIYDGNQLYAERADYKKAVVMAGTQEVAKETEDSITYTWYKHVSDDLTDCEFDDDTNELYAKPEENTFDSDINWIKEELYVSPYEAGIYKLVITYKDAQKDEYLASSASIYYVIEKQPVKVTFNGEYKALTGTSFLDFYNNYYLNQLDTYSVNMISGDELLPLEWNESSDYYIDFYIIETLLAEQYDEKGELIKDASGNPVLSPQTRQISHTCDGISYTIVDASGNPVKEIAENKYSAYMENMKFKENAQYKLTATLSKYSDNYTNEKTVIEDVTFLKDIETKTKETHKVRSTECLNDKAEIKVEKMGETALAISIDDKVKAGTFEKEYDGLAFDLNSVIGTDSVKVVKAEDGKTEISDVTLTYEWYGDDGYGDQNYWTQAVNAGEYTLYASFAGNTIYAPIERTEIAKVKILPVKLTVTPVVNETIVAGACAREVYENNYLFQSAIIVEGAVEGDKWAFEYMNPSSYCYYAAWEDDSLNCEIKLDEDNINSNAVLKGEKTYTLKINDSLVAPYCTNYDVEYKEAIFTTVRGNSIVYPSDKYLTSEYLTNKVEDDGDASASIKEAVSEMNHVITTLDAIPYSYHKLNGDKSNTYGNFLEVRIEAPAEYEGKIPDTAMYKNSIEAQGGITLEGDGYIYVIFDASARDVKEFDVRWEDGYVEHFEFDFTNSELMGNLAEAVAPKTIKFNAPVVKMAVGEEQALDLAMTKVQKNDIVCIAYESSDTKVLSVDEHGEVTALSVGSATIKAYPTKIADGQRVAIDGAKTATVKITVTNVTAPKIKNVTPLDYKAEIDYSIVNDGYRREIYVLEGKNIKITEFETKIAAMKNEQWQDIFAIAPIYRTQVTENKYHTSSKTTYRWLYGLEPDTPYTVYVRNVSAVRSLADGCQVTLSASGSIKSFTTTKAQVKELEGSVKDAVYTEYDEYGEEVDYYTVKLSDKKAKISTMGWFEEKASNSAADIYDEHYDAIGYELPLSKALQDTFVNPKLIYGVYSDTTNSYIPSPIASVDKKGNLKLKGVGTVYVRIEDVTTGIYDYVELHIVANADKVKGNKVKLGVGESVLLEDLLTYYEGSKKLTGDYDRNIIIDEEIISKFEGNEYFIFNPNEKCITAVKAGGKIELSLTDGYVEQAGGTATATATINSKELAPVKGLKLLNTKNLKFGYANVTDKFAWIQFSYEGGAEAFKIEVKDSRGRLILSRYTKRDTLLNNGYYNRGIDNKYYYMYSIGGLTQQTKYSVTVTPMYDDILGKSAKLSVKTTKIPAAYFRLNDDDEDAGLYMYVCTDGSEIHDMLDDNKLFVSGNTYTLYAAPHNYQAESTASDTLIWSSSNKKVATVKANSGSYYATFKALKAGITTIEVKSKITKEVIARYNVEVTSVGDGYGKGRRYYEDNEPDSLDSVPHVYDVELELNKSKTIQMGSKSEKWISYTAPTDGVYKFKIDNGTTELYSTLSGDALAKGDNIVHIMSAKETIYFKLKKSYGDSVSVYTYKYYYQTLSMNRASNVSQSNYMYLEFTAPEDGIYAFEIYGNDRIEYSYIEAYERIGSDYITLDENDYGYAKGLLQMEKDQTVYLRTYTYYSGYKVKAYKYTPVQLNFGTSLEVDLEKGQKEWIEFTATENNTYTFTAKDNDSSNNTSVRMTFYNKAGGEYITKTSTNNGECAYECELEKGQKVYIKVSEMTIGEGHKVDATLSVTKCDVVQANKTVALDIAENEQKWLVFTAEEDGQYTFNTGRQEGDETSQSKLCLYKNKNAHQISVTAKPSGSAQLNYAMATGQSVYILVCGGAEQGAAKLNLTVTKKETSLITLNTDLIVSLDADEEKYYEFKATEDGIYNFVADKTEQSDKVNVYLDFYSNYRGNTTLYSNENFYNTIMTREAVLKAGEIVYVKVCNSSSESKFVLSVSKADISEVTIANPVMVQEGTESDSRKKWVKFTAPETALYKFMVTQEEGNTDMQNLLHAYYIHSYKYYNNHSDIYFYPNETKTKEFRIVKGQTIFWKVINKNDTAIRLEVEKTKDIYTLNTDSKVSVKLNYYNYDNDVAWVAFTAPSDGTYKFSTSGEYGKVYMYVYKGLNANSSKSGYSATIDMNAGETYFVQLRNTGYSDIQNCTLSVEGQ